MKKYLTAVMLALVSIGCDKPAQSTYTPSNSNFQVEVLFTDNEGFTVKRFADGSRNYYYVTGPGAAQIQWEISGNKNQSAKHYNVPTLEK